MSLELRQISRRNFVLISETGGIMTAKDLFGVIIRIVGLFITVLGVAYFLGGVFGTHPPDDPTGSQHISYGIVCLIAGLYLLRGAPLLMRYSYPD